MVDLPIGTHAFYAGIDPGFTGALSVMNAKGTTLKVWDMPTTGTGKKKEIDLEGLEKVFKHIARLPDVVLGLEWPTTRPGEGAERSERFGRGKGYLEAFAFLKRIDYYLLAPNLWKGRLGLPGKSDKEADKKGLAVLDLYYSAHHDTFVGPRGGVRSGRVDAACIAHFLRTRSAGGLRSVVETHGKDSPQAWAMALGGGRRKIMRGQS